MHAEVAGAYEQAGLLAEAIRECERALALCPTFVDIRSELGATLRAIGRLAAAAREFERVARENRQAASARACSWA